MFALKCTFITVTLSISAHPHNVFASIDARMNCASYQQRMEDADCNANYSDQAASSLPAGS